MFQTYKHTSMDFLKNINKEFILTSDFNFIKENYHYIFKKGDDINLGTVKVKTSDLNTSKAEFYITEIENIDDVVTQVAELLIKNVTRDVNKYKKAAKKVLKAWNESPEEFKQQKDRYSKDTYKRRGLLINKEYHQSVFILFDNLSIHPDYGFTTGCGGDTYYAKEVYEENLESIDQWLEKMKKELVSSKIKKRLKNYIMKNTVTIPIGKLEESIALSTDEIKVSNSSKKSKSPKKPEFPVKFTASQMNYFLSEYGEAFLDEEMIEEFNSQNDVDISPLLHWEILVEHEGYHHNDGQVCDYTATFIHPDGHEYYVGSSHSLMTGWNLWKDEEAQPS